MKSTHTQCIEDHFASPASIADESCDIKNERMSLGDKILFFERNSVVPAKKDEAISNLGSSKVAQLRKKFSKMIPEDGEEINFASSDINSFSTETLDKEFCEEERDMADSPPVISISVNDGAASKIPDKAVIPAQPSSKNNPLTAVNDSAKADVMNIRDIINKIENKTSSKTGSAANDIKSIHFPSSSELIQDFTKFPSRPSFLKIPSHLPDLRCIKSENLYRNKNILFSNIDVSLSPFVFRGPGPVLSSKPHLSLCNSLLTEVGVRHYIKVHTPGTTKDLSSIWYVLKQLEDPEFNLALLSKDEHSLSSFILSDIVTDIYKRTSFILFNGEKVLGKLIGRTLCLCTKDKCIKAIGIERVEKTGKVGITVNGVNLELSCETERNEWVSVLKKYE
ncbi:uncharacterized protein VICG_01835 [Vittaforma corneae ATCC 50505]|uniref:Uncharacterized protein n=1 Tax=Vittaforma corneae (strain ATCC 50505) TaxID=993615 RepID=L2GJX0_VITCO|nr:uncharacterized protein VICG_01835 [Vittaforma corneae ATCC 50505]ELA41136.1 hypothetical protein VICG_01835 [Vittaforma corneae ATCC 50505]